ncbi:hypothetical protein [Streptomyces sp. NBC_01235]|uniref:hypothetical protein n=1 Tax=Streptomyces sp. NBC_01235 TaxID=2903788 RepID=UPI002E157275|nr:hypothetical protein OG289_29805 [Streptomyces sp. NBC_01235]
MTKPGKDQTRKTDIRIGLIGGHRLNGATLHERTLAVSLVGGAGVDLTGVEIPDGAELRITKLSLIGGVSLKVRPDVRVDVRGLRLGGVQDQGPTEPNGPTVRVGAWGLLGGVTVRRGRALRRQVR